MRHDISVNFWVNCSKHPTTLCRYYPLKIEKIQFIKHNSLVINIIELYCHWFQTPHNSIDFLPKIFWSRVVSNTATICFHFWAIHLNSSGIASYLRCACNPLKIGKNAIYKTLSCINTSHWTILLVIPNTAPQYAFFPNIFLISTSQ